MILLDSSLIVAYLNEADVNHVKALKVIEDVDKDRYGTPVITDYVFDEVITVMLVKTKDVQRVTEIGEKLLSANMLLKIDGETFNQAWNIFKNQRGPHFSFTDCTSLAACRASGVSNIATFDEDFGEVEELRKIGL